jgi:hypothetical protein
VGFRTNQKRRKKKYVPVLGIEEQVECEFQILTDPTE